MPEGWWATARTRALPSSCAHLRRKWQKPLRAGRRQGFPPPLVEPNPASAAGSSLVHEDDRPLRFLRSDPPETALHWRAVLCEECGLKLRATARTFGLNSPARTSY